MKRVIFLVTVCALLLLSACGNQTSGASSAASATSADVSSVSGSAAQPQSRDDHAAFFGQVTDYLMGTQSDLPDALKLTWSPSFLDAVDQEPVYQAYLAAGGAKDDVAAFASYLTLNAPVPDNWKTMFEEDFATAYGKKISRYADLGDDFYQVYVNLNGSEVPYVVVNTRTGAYHG